MVRFTSTAAAATLQHGGPRNMHRKRSKLRQPPMRTLRIIY